MDVTKTEAYGPGLEGGVTKEPTHFTIVTKNKNGDPIPTGGEKFDVKIAGPYNSGTQLSYIPLSINLSLSLTCSLAHSFLYRRKTRCN